MGLTFSQEFYTVPDEVFLVICKNGHPKAILEIPEDDDKALLLKKQFDSDIYKVVRLNFDDLIIAGYNYLKEQGVENRREKFDIY